MINTRVIEKKWQKRWEEEGVFTAKNNSDKEKYYILVEFPYPSGAGLHVGHVRTKFHILSSLINALGTKWSTCTFCPSFDSFLPQ